MTRCILLYPPGKTIAFEKVHDSDEPLEGLIVRSVEECIGDLAPVVRPIALDLALACRERESDFLDLDIFPAQTHWHIRESDPPEHIALEPKSAEDFQLADAPSLTAEVVSRWVSQALAQSPPSPEHVVTLYTLDCAYTRARLFDRGLFGTTRELQLQDGDVTWKIPVEQRDGGLWVSGPPQGLSLYPAVSFQLSCDYGLLKLRVRASWSLWAERGTQEQEALQSALRAVAAHGWKPNVTPRDFDL